MRAARRLIRKCVACTLIINYDGNDYTARGIGYSEGGPCKSTKPADQLLSVEYIAKIITRQLGI